MFYMISIKERSTFFCSLVRVFHFVSSLRRELKGGGQEFNSFQLSQRNNWSRGERAG